MFRSICLIGLTGHGKSHTCNTLSKSEHFKVSADTDSETEKVSGVVTRWRKEPKGEPCIVIDTPGMGDSKGRDTAHIANMVIDLKTIGYVHTFIIAINSEEPRLSEHLQATILLFSHMFSKDFFKNVLICLTKFNNSKKANNLRASGKKITRDKLIEKYQQMFTEKFQVEIKACQFTFIDNGIDLPEAEAEEIELREFNKTLEHILTTVKTSKPFFCQDIKKVLAEKDQLRKQIEQIQAKQDQERAAFEAE